MTTSTLNGQTVYTYAQALFGGGRKVKGTVKQCAKHAWVIFEDGSRVRFDKGYFFTKEEEEKGIEDLKKHNQLQRQQAELLQKKIEEIKNKESFVVFGEKAIKTVIGEFDASVYEYTYEITDNADGKLFGRMISATKDGSILDIGYQPETFIGTI